ncbi:MAG TPA: PmoA family protein [Chitinophaga sp.]|uniref:DUF6807 domain-containing protein n=1 Tax=Chitinophaga sp. TaxID=1869181 RepID=UPI002C1AE7A3|nr:PmoA family protein [Chitinophaga sp.]HVI44296.1 PmoA family protein [Chitinophaga sp.]
MKVYLIIPFLILLLHHALYAQVIARYEVRAGNLKRMNSIVYAPMKDSTDERLLRMEEVTNGKRIPVPVTIHNDSVSWMLSGVTNAGATRRYELKKTRTPLAAMPDMRVNDYAGAIILQQNDRKILQYNHATVEPPAGTDTLYRRNAFIHPLWAPNGAVLTNIFPNAGHRHHMGIWNPWTHTYFEGRETDFWNIQKKDGKVRFRKMLTTTIGGQWCGFTAEQDHVALLKDGREKTALHEIWDIRAYRATDNASRRLWDFTSIFTCATDSGITLMQYRYGGGFGLRTTAAFTAQTSQVLTSEGKTRKDADSTRARWVKISGTTPEGKAGMLIMNHPQNYDSPEPLRVWPEDMEGGELMFNFTPTRMKAWRLNNSNVYTLKYRILVFAGDITVEEADALWADYAQPPVVVRLP